MQLKFPFVTHNKELEPPVSLPWYNLCLAQVLQSEPLGKLFSPSFQIVITVDLALANGRMDAITQLLLATLHLAKLDI